MKHNTKSVIPKLEKDHIHKKKETQMFKDRAEKQLEHTNQPENKIKIAAL